MEELPPSIDLSLGCYTSAVRGMVLTPDGKHLASTPAVDELRMKMMRALCDFNVESQLPVQVLKTCNDIQMLNCSIYMGIMDGLYGGDDDKNAGVAAAHTGLLVVEPLETYTTLFEDVGYILPTRDILNLCRGKKVLTVGCGRGLVDYVLGDLPHTTVISTDACIEGAISKLPPFVPDRKKLTASAAVAAHGADCDIMLVCAPHCSWFKDLTDAIEAFDGTVVCVVNHVSCLDALKEKYTPRIKEMIRTQSVMALLDIILVIN